jgi:hypothetical protein
MLLHGKPLSEITDHAAKVFKYKPLLTQAIELANEGIVDIKDAQKLFLDFGE